jgi:hypothetical protein
MTCRFALAFDSAFIPLVLGGGRHSEGALFRYLVVSSSNSDLLTRLTQRKPQ